MVRKLATQSVTSSTTLVDDTELKCPVSASRVYLFEAQIAYTGSAAGDIKIAFTGPSGAVIRWQPMGSIQINSGDTIAAVSSEVSEGGTLTYGAATGTRTASIRGRITTSTTAGYLQLQFA